MGTWNSRDRETVSGTDFGDRMGVVADSSRNPLSTRSMWRATGADGGCSRIIATIQRASSTELPAESGEKRRRAVPVKVRPFCASKQQKNAHFHCLKTSLQKRGRIHETSCSVVIFCSP